MKKMKDNSPKIVDKNNNPMASGFTVPASYFDTIEDHFSAKLKEETLPTETGFRVDESYFTGLEDRILTKVAQSPKKQTSLKTKIIRLIPYAAAACILVFVGLTQFNYTSSDISNADVETWLDSNISLISNEDFVTILEQSDISDNEFSLAAISDNAILEYLQTTDTSYLINETP